MGIWKMSQLKAPPLTDDPVELRKYISYLSNQIAIMFKDLDFTLNGDINFQNVKAKSITADRMDVTELSAITANMGKLTSGQIFGAYIATVEAAFPRCELDSSINRIRSAYTENDYISMEPSFGGAPALTFLSPFNTTVISGDSTNASITTDRDMVISTGAGDIKMSVGIGNSIKFDDFYTIHSTFDGTSLGAILQSLSDRITALGG